MAETQYGIESDCDERLVARYFETGDASDFEGIVRRFTPYLRKYLRSRYQCLYDSLEDVLQETWMRVYEKLYQYDASRPFLPWLKQVASSQAANVLRKLEHWNHVRDNYLEFNYTRISKASESWRFDASRAAEQREAREILKKGIERLPESQRIVMEATVARDYGGPSVAEVLNLAPSTVSRRLQQARASVAAYYRRMTSLG